MMNSSLICENVIQLANLMVYTTIRKQSKVILELPTNNSIMETFEKTLTGGFSCVNTRLAFDTEILMPNLTETDYKKMNNDESF